MHADYLKELFAAGPNARQFHDGWRGRNGSERSRGCLGLGVLTTEARNTVSWRLTDECDVAAAVVLPAGRGAIPPSPRRIFNLADRG